MVVKRVLCPERLRRVPPQFSWIDHRLVRDGQISRCTPEALALYLLLVTVGDAEGLSYYSDRTVTRLINLDEAAVVKARRSLMRAELIAYRKPLYQVLSLEEPEARRVGGMVSIGDVLKDLAGGKV